MMSLTATTPAAECAPRDVRWELGPRDTLAPGRRVVRRLGGGGAHEAFLVELGGPHAHAVAKLPRPHLAGDPHCLLRLRDEGRALERLAHPAVPTHLDTVLAGPHPHLLLEHVPGPTLRTVLAARRRPAPTLVARLGCALALALDHFARAGWVHLDVKPSNIVMNAHPRLLDFELARPAAKAACMTRPTGTWHYMPPEQRSAGVAGAAEIGPPADVFALAASLSEALGGRGARRSRVRSLLGEALAPAPGNRPTAAELADELGELSGPPAVELAA